MIRNALQKSTFPRNLIKEFVHNNPLNDVIKDLLWEYSIFPSKFSENNFILIIDKLTYSHTFSQSNCGRYLITSWKSQRRYPIESVEENKNIQDDNYTYFYIYSLKHVLHHHFFLIFISIMQVYFLVKNWFERSNMFIQLIFLNKFIHATRWLALTLLVHHRLEYFFTAITHSKKTSFSNTSKLPT